MKKILVLAVACALVSGAAMAVWNAQDVVPAASLLVPYAVVDVDSSDVPNPAGYTTLFAIINTSAYPQLVHLTAWNASSVPVVDWDVLLTGYDVWGINFADLLNGRFDKFDTVPDGLPWVPPSGHTYTPNSYGPASNYVAHSLMYAGFWLYPADFAGYPDRDFTTLGTDCRMPYGDLTGLGSTIRRNIRSGEPSLAYQLYNCVSSTTQYQANTTWTSDLSKAPLFFYVTADVVRVCTQVFQTTDAYWSGIGINAADNVLTGDILYFNATKNYSEMINAVHLEAYPAAAQMTGIRTFYEIDLHDRSVFANNAGSTGAWDAAAPVTTATLVDDREPLGRSYAFRYATSPAPVSAEVVVWKSAFEWATFTTYGRTAFACTPYEYYAWNEDELTKSTTGGPSGFAVVQPNALPFETQSVPLTVANFPGLVQIKTCASCTGGAGYGWMWINFTGGDYTADIYNDDDSAAYYEAWVGLRFIFGTYSAATEATLMNTRWNRGLQWNLTLAGVGAHVVNLPTQ